MLIWRNLIAGEQGLHFDKFHEQESRTIFLSPAPNLCNNDDKNKISDKKSWN